MVEKSTVSHVLHVKFGPNCLDLRRISEQQKIIDYWRLELARTKVKWSQKTGQLAKVYPKPRKGYENGEAPEFYRSV